LVEESEALKLNMLPTSIIQKHLILQLIQSTL